MCNVDFSDDCTRKFACTQFEAASMCLCTKLCTIAKVGSKRGFPDCPGCEKRVAPPQKNDSPVKLGLRHLYSFPSVLLTAEGRENDCRRGQGSEGGE